MKLPAKIFTAISVMAISVSLVSCKNNDKVSLPNTDFSYSVVATCELSGYNEEYSLTLTRTDAGIWCSQFSAPMSLSGMKLSQGIDQCTIEYMGLTHTASLDKFPDNSLVPAITSVLDHIACTTEIDATSEGGNIIADGSIDGIIYSVVFYGNEPISMQISSSQRAINVMLTDFQKL